MMFSIVFLFYHITHGRDNPRAVDVETFKKSS